MSHEPSDFAGVKIFRGLSADAHGALDAVAVEHLVQPGQSLTHEGQQEVPVCFIIEGSLRTYRTSSEGRQQTIARIGEGGVFNLPPAFDADGTGPATTEAVEPSRVLCIPQAAFRRVASENPEVALAVMRTLSHKLRYLVGLTHDLALLSVRARLARYLLHRALELGPEAAHTTHEEIAASIGTVREVVSRSLGAFARAGLVRVGRGTVEVLDRAGLEAELGD